MAVKCILCGDYIQEENEKLKGTILKVKENNKNKFVYVCSACQKNSDWIEKAKIKSA
jgi:uncharacterized protein YlaI